MQTQPKSGWLKSFIDNLKDILKDPPYLVSFFASTILLITSLIARSEYLKIFLAAFFYSLFGIVWRHAIKDMTGWIGRVYPNKAPKINFWLTVFYQFINLIVVIVLIVFIVKYCV